MRRPLLLLGLLLALPPARADAAPAPAISVGIPSDFAGLAQNQEIVADFFFGGRRLGQFEVDATPGRLRIAKPELVVAALSGVLDPAALTTALSGALDTNAHLVCTNPDIPCTRPTPDTAAIVFDQAHFRVDLFVAPRLLAVRPVLSDRYLKPAGRGLSLVDTIGGALAGGDGQKTLYDVRNHLTLGAGDVRLSSEASIGSSRGADIDTAAIEVDRPERRYAAGLFYATGADLVGRRRIVGVGASSQFDTHADRTLITGTPLVVFLSQRSRVDLLAEGRLISSHVYEAGNQTLDTASLPDGSYPVEIRIQENGGATRVEQRFFTKSATIPPPGRTIFFANAGVLAIDRPDRPLMLSHTPIATGGVARRIGAHFAWDATVMATRQRGLTEVGLTAFTGTMQARVALLASTRGDYGFLAQANSAAGGRFTYSFDLRRVASRDNAPLIPLDEYAVDPLSVGDVQAAQAQLTATTFTQLAANLSYRIGRAQLGVSTYLRRDVGQPTSYAIGPVVHWPIFQREKFQLVFDGNYAQTDRGCSVAFGLRFQLFGHRASLSGSVGAQTTTLGNGHRIGGLAELGGSVQRDDPLGGQFNGGGSVQQSGDGTLLQANVDDRGPAGYGSASLVHRSGVGAASTQYALSMQTSVAASSHVFRIGAHDQTDSVIAVSLAGTASRTRFEVLLDDSPRGIVRPGGRLTLAVTPYRRYTVRLRPVGGDLVTFDAQARTVDVYPGTVALLAWKADPVVAMFGRLVRPDGKPIVNADIVTGGAISATDDHGYFQLQAAHDATLSVRSPDDRTCRATVAATRSNNGYTALGDVTCLP